MTGGLGLSTRLSLALVLLVVVAQAASLLGLLAFQQANQGGWSAPAPVRIAAAAEALERTAPGERDRLLVALNGDASRFYIGERPPGGYRERHGPVSAALESYAAALRGRDLRIYWPAEPPRYRPRFAGRRTASYVISVALADGSRLMVAPGLGYRRRSLAAAALLLNLAVGVAAALLAWRTVRGATRELEAIARASDRFAVDLSAPPMDERGGDEARQVASAFNRMRSRIQALMNERMRMLAAAAHDLKTLMTRLRLRVALIADDDQRARADRDIALMAGLIEDVLLVAKGEEKPVRLEPVDVAAILAEAAKERQALGQAVSLGPLDVGPVPADPSSVRRIVENLVENAVAYAGAAELRFERTPDRWRLLVIDHGPGLEPDFAARAFEPFSRGEDSRSRDTGGAGLGLAIVRSLARQMGGDVRLETAPGGGVTAVVEAPA